jgi:hypothetical protein
MAFKRINSTYFMADTVEDLNNLPEVEMGTECFVIEAACEYRISSDGKWFNQTPSASTSTEGESVDLSNYITKEELDSALANFEDEPVDLSGYATKEELANYVSKEEMGETKVETMFGETEENMASNPGSAFGIAVNKGETEGIVEKMFAKGIGLYTFWISKDNADLPAAVKEKNSSCRGLCCVDTVKETGWYGWIQLFDHDGYMYTRYIRNSVPTEWRSC